MPAPTEPRPDTGQTSPPSASSNIDETVTAGASAGAAVATGFGPPAAPGEVGTLGPYRVVKELGRGGMGAVYAAIDTRLERRLALKVMLPEFAADASAKDRFLREARAAAKVKHDNVVTVYEADEREGVPYIAMEFLEGYPLDAYLKKKGSPTVPQILRIASEAASGLAAAHKLGLVHRDIKPGNLWLEAPNGRVKVLDFGLARPVHAEHEITQSGAIVGTPAYMSPEQARGEKVDARTDLFSLGALMYRLCTGKLPFSGPSTMAVLMALGTEEPTPVRELNPQVPESLAALIHQLLSKKADARPQSATEVVKRLRAIAQELAAPVARSAELSTSQPQVMQPQVVYVPMPVTVQEANPFADIDATATELPSREVAESAAEPAKPKPSRAKSGGRGAWVLAGVAVLLAVAAAGVVIVIRNKDGSETKIEVPDGATVTVKDKGGKTLARVGPEAKKPATDTSPDRKAAEWVLSLGGVVSVNGEERVIKAAAELLKEPFTLTAVNLHQNKLVTDAGLDHLKHCKGLAGLDLWGTQVTDAGLDRLKDLRALTRLDLHDTQVSDAGMTNLRDLKSLTSLSLHGTRVSDAGLTNLKDCKQLTSLSLHNTKVTDAGLECLKEFEGLTALDLWGTRVTDVGSKYLTECKNLTALTLHGTQLSDAGLTHLKKLKSLTHLDVWKTKVTAKGLADFHAAVPACQIQHDGGVIEAVDVDRKAAEWVIAQGGTVRVNGGAKDIKAVADLPKELFSLTTANPAWKAVTDDDLARFKDCKGLTSLGLQGTQVTDAGLEHLKELKNLTELYLHGTAVTGAGLARLKVLTELKALTLGEKITDESLLHLKNLKGPLNLGLQGTQVTDAGLEHLKELKKLIRLDVRKTKVTAKGLAEFHAAVPGCKIEHDGGVIEAVDVDRKAAEWVLSIGGTVRVNAEGREIKAAAELPKERFTLVGVRLPTNKSVSDAGLAHLRGLRSLTELVLSGTQVSDAGLEHLRELKTLTDLRLSLTQVSDDGLACLSGLTNLTRLELYHAKVGDAGMAHLKGLKALTDLRMDGSQVGDVGLEHLKGCTALKVLFVGNTRVSDAGLEHLKGLKGLTELSLFGRPITDAGLAHLRDLAALKHLDLSGARVTDAGLMDLRGLKALRHLAAHKTEVTAKGLEAFHAAVPGCRIEHDGGIIEPKK